MKAETAGLFLGPLNRVLLQWFCIRLAMVVDLDTRRVREWKILWGIVPTTGWTAPYRYLPGFGPR